VTAAAQAGYNIAAFDIFNDDDTRRCCFYSAQVKFADVGFDADDLLRHLGECDLEDAAILYGSGLESQPKLLAQIANRYHLLGNSADVVAEIKHPRRFFQRLDQLAIAHPETVFDIPANIAGWLVKSGGGSGGTHIRRHGGRNDGYYQREVEGLPVSVLFLTDGSNIEVVGYNEQLLAPTLTMPFRYGGVVGNIDLPVEVKIAMAEAAQKVTSAVGLRGLNSMDFMLGVQGALALEINPRLSASFELYDIPDLLDRHLQACQGRLTPLLHRPWGAKACLIHYADRDILVPDDAVWPEWAVDLPSAGRRIRAGDPVCSVLASADNAIQAKALAFARAGQLMHNVRLLELNPEIA
jgi:predicted ATP-grasp superfamily ATP-dependent carboligase